MKKILVSMLVLALAGSAFAALGDVSTTGLTGLWRFQAEDPATGRATMAATVGTDLVNSHPDNAENWLGPWTDLGVPAWHTMYSDGGIAQDRSWDHLTCYHGIASGNGGGTYINEYTIVMDISAGSGWNSLYQTAWSGNANDGDLWIDASTQTAAVIGVGGGPGYSTATFDATKWHRIVLSVDNGNFFRAYVDGVLFLDGAGQAIDGRWSLELDRFNLFADDSWEDAWLMCGTVGVWNRAMGNAEVADLGGWLGGSATPTPLVIVPEPATMAILALGGLLIRRKK